MSKRREIPASVQIENAQRAIFLTSQIEESTYARLSPEIVRLKLQSAEPICLFIHSFGGDPFAAEQIHRLIRSPRQDGHRCMMTTVCIGVAASAAGDLLSAGDYAIAYSDSLIHIHGTREQHSEITVEKIPEVEASLREGNEYFAMKLAEKMFRRFATQALLLEVFKTSPPANNVTAVAADPGEILATIQKNVSHQHAALVVSAIDRLNRIKKLSEYVQERLRSQDQHSLMRDNLILKHVVDFETGALKDQNATGFSSETLSLIRDDFHHLKELMSGSYLEQARALSHLRGHYFLSKLEMDEFRKIPPAQKKERSIFLEEKASPKIFPLWYLVVSLCRLLQQGENGFNAPDAWYFGLVDEALGTSLPSLRLWRESREQKPIPPKQIPPTPPLSSAP